MGKYVCIDNTNCAVKLNLYKIYELHSCDPIYCYLDNQMLLMSRFISLDDYRDEKINKLLNG